MAVDAASLLELGIETVNTQMGTPNTSFSSSVPGLLALHVHHSQRPEFTQLPDQAGELHLSSHSMLLLSLASSSLGFLHMMSPVLSGWNSFQRGFVPQAKELYSNTGFCRLILLSLFLCSVFLPPFLW